MKLVVGSDHAAYELKEAIKEKLISEGHEVIDVGCDSTESVDYPKYGHAVGRTVASGSTDTLLDALWRPARPSAASPCAARESASASPAIKCLASEPHSAHPQRWQRCADATTTLTLSAWVHV